MWNNPSPGRSSISTRTLSLLTDWNFTNCRGVTVTLSTTEIGTGYGKSLLMMPFSISLALGHDALKASRT